MPRFGQLALFVQHLTLHAPGPAGQIGFVCSQGHPSALLNTPNWVCLYNIHWPPPHPARPGIGFVSHARLQPIGFVCTTGSRRLDAAGRRRDGPAPTLSSIRHPRSETRNSTRPHPRVSWFRLQIVNHNSSITNQRTSLYLGAVLHESCRNSAYGRGPKVAQLLVLKGIKNFLHMGCFTFSTVAQMLTVRSPMVNMSTVVPAEPGSGQSCF